METSPKWFVILLFAVLNCSIVTAEEEDKIVGGVAVEISKYPYMVSVQYNNRHFCGATIRSNVSIVIAAHCLYGLNGNITGLTIVAGQTKLSDTTGQTIAVASMVSHPKFNISTIDYDAGIITLATPLTFNDKVSALPLSNTNVKYPYLFHSSDITVTGWGVTAENSQTVSDTLRSVNVPPKDNTLCRIVYGAQFTDRMFCAGNLLGGKDSCQGDSGGPAAQDGAQVGIVSFGYGCARPNAYGVYTNTFHPEIREFIEANAAV